METNMQINKNKAEADQSVFVSIEERLNSKTRESHSILCRLEELRDIIYHGEGRPRPETVAKDCKAPEDRFEAIMMKLDGMQYNQNACHNIIAELMSKFKK